MKHIWAYRWAGSWKKVLGTAVGGGMVLGVGLCWLDPPHGFSAWAWEAFDVPFLWSVGVVNVASHLIRKHTRYERQRNLEYNMKIQALLMRKYRKDGTL